MLAWQAASSTQSWEKKSSKRIPRFNAKASMGRRMATWLLLARASEH